jgi:hypothetical protein
MRSKSLICVLLVICSSLAALASADQTAHEPLSGEGLVTEKEAVDAQPNSSVDSNLLDDFLISDDNPTEETDSDGQEGDPAGHNDELEEEHEYFDHIDSNKGST